MRKRNAIPTPYRGRFLGQYRSVGLIYIEHVPGKKVTLGVWKTRTAKGHEKNFMRKGNEVVPSGNGDCNI